jgi:hypothetical protein
MDNWRQIFSIEGDTIMFLAFLSSKVLGILFPFLCKVTYQDLDRMLSMESRAITNYFKIIILGHALSGPLVIQSHLKLVLPAQLKTCQ